MNKENRNTLGIAVLLMAIFAAAIVLIALATGAAAETTDTLPPYNTLPYESTTTTTTDYGQCGDLPCCPPVYYDGVNPPVWLDGNPPDYDCNGDGYVTLPIDPDVTCDADRCPVTTTTFPDAELIPATVQIAPSFTG